MGLQNTNARNDTTMRCFLFGWMRSYLCKIVARWVYKHDDSFIARDDIDDDMTGCDVLSYGTLSSCNNFMAPKRRFWDAERNARCVFSKHLSTFRGPNAVITPLISASPGNAFGKVCSTVQHLRFGEHKRCQMITKDSSMRCVDFIGCDYLS
jgi:hypothetical protein